MNKKHLLTRKTLQNTASFDSIESLLECSTLSSFDKDIVKLHYCEDKTFMEIGDMFGYSESGIKKRHEKILKKLSQLI